MPGRSPITLLILLALIACRGPAEPAGETVDSRPRNVVLVVGDALRVHSLPFYGYARSTAPFLTSMASRSLVYENAYSHYSSTWATFANLFTGLPYSSLVEQELFTATSRRSQSGGLVPANETLAELLQARGVRSRAVSANPYLAKSHGFGQGFEAYHDWSDWDPDFWDSVRKIRAAEVNRVAMRHLDELAATGDPWLLFLLYFETHNPYQAEPEYRAGLVDEAAARRDRNRGGSPRDRDGETLKYLTDDLRDWYTAADVAHLTSLYDAEVRAFDDGVRRLVEGLRERGLLDDTIVIVTADHGESLFDRDYWGHGFLSRDEVQHVPLLVYNSGVAPARIANVTGTSDLFHSLSRHFGVASESPARVPWATDVLTGAAKRPVMLSEGPGSTRIFRDSRYALYRHGNIENRFPLPARNGDYLFDRRFDPGEIHNLFEDPARADEAAATMHRLLRDLVLEIAAEAPAEDPFLEGDEERLRRLRALGYVR